jgi:CubicO group peptidase (beta-lactamase class C family)
MTSAEILTAIADLASHDHRPISIASRTRNGVSEYAAVFVKDGMPGADWQVSLGVEPTFLAGQIQTKWSDGFYPFRITTERGPLTRFNVLWTKRPPGLAVEIRLDLTLDTFKAEDALRRAQGFHLESLARHAYANHERYVAVWVRYEPCLRWVGTQFDHPEYATKHQMFHDQALVVMNAGNTAGAWLRPSTTLHIVDGGQTVLNRAYTFAPAIYPDTPIDAPMRLGSVAKSITAAAVVKIMNDQQLPLTTGYAAAAGIAALVPGPMIPVSVLDVLRNFGGFRGRVAITSGGVTFSAAGDPDSYGDHTIIDATFYGAIPIAGSEMFNYMIGDGHLDMGPDPDSYWDSSRYADSQGSVRHHYSNTGYTMLGELVQRMSGGTYEQYVADNLLAPLGLQQRVYLDPGNRKDERSPTAAGLRSYLINGDHPYRMANPVEPLFGSEPLPPVTLGAFRDFAMSWRENVAPPDPAVPAFASSIRYGGRLYVGGAVLAAGGWMSDGLSLALLIRTLSRTNTLMPLTVASQLWDTQWWVMTGVPAMGWAYGLGWYVRGNWVAWAGGTSGGMATILHNQFYDFTVVHLTNVLGNGVGVFANPLMATPQGVPGTSPIGLLFPCTNVTGNECLAGASTPY